MTVEEKWSIADWEDEIKGRIMGMSDIKDLARRVLSDKEYDQYIAVRREEGLEE